MDKCYLRTYQEYDFDTVKAHLLILGDLSADCAACRALGIDPYTATSCPQCGTDFRFVTSRRIENHPEERYQIIRRFRDKRSDIPFIDFGDFNKSLGHKKARELFG